MSLLNVELKKLHAKQGIKFESGFMNQGARKMMTADVFKIMRSENGLWKLDNKLYETYHFDKIFEFMRDNNVQVLLLNDNCRPNIIKEILKPSFHQLQELNLSKNLIISIQHLPDIKAPKLAKLDISQNLITTLRSLDHLLFPLTCLKISDNPIRDVDILTRSSFKGLTEFDLENTSKNRVIGQSLLWLMKFPSKKLTALRCASRRRIKEPSLYPQLAQHYPHGCISLH